MALVPGGAPSARADAATWRGRLYADRFLIGCATVAGLVAVAIMFGMCGASLNFAIRADITLRNVVVDPALLYSLIRSCRNKGSSRPGTFVASATQSLLWRGTDGSNPSPYSGESTNLRFL